MAASNARVRHLLHALSSGTLPSATAATADGDALRARLAELQREQDAIQLELANMTQRAMSSVDNVFLPPGEDFTMEETVAFFKTNGVRASYIVPPS
jgi:hypothetical protein